MNDRVIPVPKINYINSNIDGFLWKANKVTDGENVAFDFSAVEFLRPESVILLIVVSKEIFEKTHNPVNWINLCNDIPQYLERIDISRLPFIIFQKPQKKLLWNRSAHSSQNLIEVEIIDTPKKIGDVTTRTREILAQWFPTGVGTGYCKQAARYISEIAGNSLEHSVVQGNGICYFTLQKYIYNRQQPQVIIAFGDAGIGIRKSLKQVYDWIQPNDAAAIKLALIEGKSGRVSGDGGLGFQSIISLLQRYGGSIAIRSGQGSIYYVPRKKEIKTIEHKNSLIGTQTSFVL